MTTHPLLCATKCSPEDIYRVHAVPFLVLPFFITVVMSVGLKAGSLALLVVLVAYLYSSRKSEDVLQEHLDTVLSGLLRAEKKVPLGSPRVAVGLGACLDVIGDANEILEKIQARAPEEPEHFNHIQDLNQLEKVFTYFFQHGAAAE